MVAMHGREDPLLEPARFARLLRQANDAEIADVRKVGEDDYEIAPHRRGTPPQLPVATPALPPAREEPAADGAGAEAPEPVEVVEPVAAGRENGIRLGLRFRRGSRGGLRAGEIPLIGVVQVDAQPEPEPVVVEVPAALLEPAALETPVEPEAAPKKPARPRRSPRKKAAVAAAQAPAPEESPPAEAPSPRKRPRARPRKKAE